MTKPLPSQNKIFNRSALKPIYTSGLFKQMVWIYWKTFHLTILLNTDR